MQDDNVTSLDDKRAEATEPDAETPEESTEEIPAGPGPDADIPEPEDSALPVDPETTEPRTDLLGDDVTPDTVKAAVEGSKRRRAVKAETEMSTLLQRATETGLKIPKSTKIQEWADAGPQVAVLEKMGPWVMGDWYLFGENKFGEDMSVALDVKEINPGTAANRASVCRAYDHKDRHPDVAFSLHRLAQGLEYSVRQAAIDFAAQYALSYREFAEYVEKLKEEPENNAEGSKRRKQKKTHVTYSLSFTLDVGDEKQGGRVADQLKEALEAKLAQLKVDATKITPNVKYTFAKK